jgi:hypothetical protein
MTQEIYLKGDRTFLKEKDDNGKTTFMQSTTKPRMFDITNVGVRIMPDGDDDGLNNKEIILDNLVDKFGATTPEELHEALGINNFFKKGGGGVSETLKIDDAFYFDNTNTLRPNITQTTKSIIYNGGSKVFDLVFHVTRILFFFRNGKKQSSSAHTFTHPSTIEILIPLNVDDELDIIYQHFINSPTV